MSAEESTWVVNDELLPPPCFVYGMGHAVYTLSDPRAVIGKRFAEQLAAGTEYEAELNLLKSIESYRLRHKMPKPRIARGFFKSRSPSVTKQPCWLQSLPTLDRDVGLGACRAARRLFVRHRL